VFSPNGIKTP